MFQISILTPDELRFLTGAAEGTGVQGKVAHIAASALQKLYDAQEVEVGIQPKSKEKANAGKQ